MSDETLDEWAEREAPELDDEQWRMAELASAEISTPAANAWALGLIGMPGVPSNASGYDCARALMAVIRRLAEGLDSYQQRVLSFRKAAPHPRLVALGLVTGGVTARLTPLGRAVARYLGSQGGDER